MYDAKEKSSLNISEIIKENEKAKHTRSGKKHFRKVDKKFILKETHLQRNIFQLMNKIPKNKIVRKKIAN
jgi:hypothetical protein